MNAPDHARTPSTTCPIVIVGAGIAGLACAHELTHAGRDVLLLEKSAGLGGRIATRSLQGVPFDYGTPVIAATDRGFRTQLEALENEGLLTAEHRDHGRVTYMAREGLRRAIASYGHGLNIQTHVRVECVTRCTSGVQITCEGGRVLDADRVVVTAPWPQAHAMLGGFSSRASGLPSSNYHRALTVALTTKHSVSLAAGLHDVNHKTMARVRVRTAEAQTLLVVEATVAAANAMFDKPDSEIVRTILTALSDVNLGGRIGVEALKATHVKRWSYGRVVAPLAAPYLDVDGNGRRLVAGDAFGAGTVEGAWLSGSAAAGYLLTAGSTRGSSKGDGEG